MISLLHEVKGSVTSARMTEKEEGSLVFAAVVVELEGDGEGDDADGHAPAGHEVAQVGEHPVLGDDVGADGVHVDGLDHVEGEHGGEEEVDADRDVAARVLRGY